MIYEHICNKLFNGALKHTVGQRDNCTIQIPYCKIQTLLICLFNIYNSIIQLKK